MINSREDEYYKYYTNIDQCEEATLVCDVDIMPNLCPVCARIIRPITLFSYEYKDKIRIVFKCPHDECDELFIGYYTEKEKDCSMLRRQIFEFKDAKPRSSVPKEFQENINEISEQFVEIYNQSKCAEELNLDQICGVGYRKAIEFLIKDYLISLDPSKGNNIKEKFLGNCIKEDVKDENIKICASRAVWLGNDETHYVKKWENKDISHLKELIELTVFWIQGEIMTRKYKANM